MLLCEVSAWPWLLTVPQRAGLPCVESLLRISYSLLRYQRAVLPVNDTPAGSRGLFAAAAATVFAIQRDMRVPLNCIPLFPLSRLSALQQGKWSTRTQCPLRVHCEIRACCPEKVHHAGKCPLVIDALTMSFAIVTAAHARVAGSIKASFSGGKKPRCPRARGRQVCK